MLQSHLGTELWPWVCYSFFRLKHQASHHLEWLPVCFLLADNLKRKYSSHTFMHRNTAFSSFPLQTRFYLSKSQSVLMLLTFSSICQHWEILSFHLCLYDGTTEILESIFLIIADEIFAIWATKEDPLPCRVKNQCIYFMYYCWMNKSNYNENKKVRETENKIIFTSIYFASYIPYTYAVYIIYTYKKIKYMTMYKNFSHDGTTRGYFTYLNYFLMHMWIS